MTTEGRVLTPKERKNLVARINRRLANRKARVEAVWFSKPEGRTMRRDGCFVESLETGVNVEELVNGHTWLWRKHRRAEVDEYLLLQNVVGLGAREIGMVKLPELAKALGIGV